MNMSKEAHTKSRATFSVDKKTEERFSKLTADLAINKSSLIEKYMLRWIAENKDRTLK